MLEVNGKRLRFARTLWVQYGGVKARDEQDAVSLEGVDGESYVKVFNTFGRVLKLFTFEEGRWIDTDTGAEATGLDESLAGHVAPAPVQPATPAGRARAKRAPAARAAAPAKKAPAPRKRAAAASSGKGKAAAASKPKGKAAPAAKTKRPAAKVSATKGSAAKGKAPTTNGSAVKGKAASKGSGAAKGKAASPKRGNKR